MSNTVLVIGEETLGGEVSVADTGMWRFGCPNTWVFSPGDEVVVRVGGGTLKTVLVIGSWCLAVTGLFDPNVSGQVTCTLLASLGCNSLFIISCCVDLGFLGFLADFFFANSVGSVIWGELETGSPFWLIMMVDK